MTAFHLCWLVSDPGIEHAGLVEWLSGTPDPSLINVIKACQMSAV